MKKIGKHMRRSLIWTAPLALIGESIILLTMSSILFWKRPDIDEIKLNVDVTEIYCYVMQFIILVSLVAYLYAITKVLGMSQETLDNESTSKKWGFLYEHLAYKKSKVLFFNHLFVARRILLVFLCILFQRPCQQI